EHRHPPGRRRGLLEELELLTRNPRAVVVYAGDISTRMRQAGHEASPYRVADRPYHDGNRAGRADRRRRHLAASGDNDVHWEADQARRPAQEAAAAVIGGLETGHQGHRFGLM